MQTLSGAWQPILSSPRERRRWIGTLAGLGLILAALTQFLDAVEQRPGVVLSDPVLARFTPIDLTWFTFALIYAALLGGLAILLHHPHHLLVAARAYAITVLMRMALMAVVPLDPPPTSIVLADPFVELFTGSGGTLTRDLFFSGHTATLSVLTLSMPLPAMRAAFAAGTLLVASAVIGQHVHYAADVLVAPLAAFTAYRIAVRISRT